ncbi:MAG: ABC transporter ATP-binding protein [Oligoflexales bacterium]|nr:ABC transporter ATP-binding protein [Oligoflexales bacterium]
MIKVRELTKVYQVEANRVEALRGIDLDVKKGQIIAVTGRSGSGKSTLLHVIGTLDQPTSGEVRLVGIDVSKMPDQQTSNFRNRMVGFVFQMNNLLPEFSALENIMIPALIAGMPKSEVHARAGELLCAVGLQNRGIHRPGELSGGEQQRVAIARALIMKPPILLADEPTGNLDKRNGEIVSELLLELCKNHGVTMLLVTHDQNLAESLPHRVFMEDGKIVEFGGAW